MYTFVYIHHSTIPCISSVFVHDHTQNIITSAKCISHPQMYSQCKQNPTHRHCNLQLTAPTFQFQSSMPENQAIITVEFHTFSQGTHMCVMIAGKALRYKSIVASVLSHRGQGIFLEHLPKSDMFDFFSSPLPQVLHTPSFWC